MSNYAERLRQLRVARKLTQRDVANVLGRAESTVRMWELGKNEPDLDTLKALASFFRVSVSYIVGETEATKLPDAEVTAASIDEDLKFALWGDTEITDEVLDEVRRFARFARASWEEREKGSGQ